MKYCAWLACLGIVVKCLSATVEGNVDPKKLLAWVDQQKAIAANLVIRANGKDMNNGGTGFCTQCSDDNSNPVAAPKTISLFKTSSTVFFDADMDIDCDGSDNGVCSGTDPSHQNFLSCDDAGIGDGQCSDNNGGPVDPVVTPFYVLPGGSPFSYSSRGIAIGQVAAVINRRSNPVSITYGPLLDEDGVSQEIGEASAAMAQLLGVPNDPNNGGTDTGIVYIVFTGTSGRLTSIADFANHQKAIAIGQALAAPLVPTEVSIPLSEKQQRILDSYQVTGHFVNIKSSGSHSITVYSLNGENVMSVRGTGMTSCNLSALRSGSYILKISLETGLFTDKILVN